MPARCCRRWMNRRAQAVTRRACSSRNITTITIIITTITTATGITTTTIITTITIIDAVRRS